MKYVDSFYLPSFNEEAKYLFPTRYPFGLFSQKNLKELYFSDITILYGSNGSGKSTLLNVMNSKFEFLRKSSFYADETFEEYVKMCHYKLSIGDDNKKMKIPFNSKIIASEDIINFVLSIRDKNIKTEEMKKEIAADYDNTKYSEYTFHSLEDYDSLSKKVEVQRKTKTRFINERTKIYRQFSNGESVLRYFDSELENDGVYLLDEPENCLSPKFQIELLKLIVECSRYCGCQFIIATHSPLLLSIPNAKIYDLDKNPVEISKWTELDNVRIYYEFFKNHKNEFEQE